ncbi:TPA: hypothetical protein U1321_001968 [Streptococcus suis]|nr:hypothetical protein [Streptococcus suis]
MKKLTKITLLSTVILTILVGCGSKSSEKTTASSETVETTQSSKEKAETVSFFADGEYKAGTDIEPGTYYVVLTELQAEGSKAYVGFQYGVDLNSLDYEYEKLNTIGKPYKVEIDSDTKFKFESWEGATIWKITFFTDEDFKEYQSSEKK